MSTSGQSRDEDKIIEVWASQFNGLLEAQDYSALASLFTPDGYLRDLAALTWHFHTYQGRDEIEAALRSTSASTMPGNFRLAGPDITKRKRKVDGTNVLETILDFETEQGMGKAILRLTEDSRDSYQATLLATIIHGLKGYPERVGEHRPVGTPSLGTVDGKNWLRRRLEEKSYQDRSPDVLVVGAGQAGLSVASRLRVLGVDTLVIDRLPRVGDVWRNRYDSLTLHNAIWLNHLPYMPFPDTWPVYVPKDKLANWFECYVEAMEINVWTSTELAEAAYDDAEARWEAKLRVADGTYRSLRPSHIVLATGVSGIPHWPHIPGMESFNGSIIHSAEFKDPSAYQGLRTIVFGTGNSAHDIAQDLYANGNCSVTMVQRSPTTVVDVETVHNIYDRYSTRLSPDHADLMLVATPYKQAIEVFRSMTTKAIERDRELIERLGEAGFYTDYGADGTGHRMKYLRTGGGYYINVGCSELIADGAIDLVHYDEVDQIVDDGVRLVNGSVIDADLIVMATGYENQQVLVQNIFGQDVAERVGPIWGYDSDGELRNMYKRTGQPGLWFHAGSLPQCRVYSRLIAIQIKACLEGLIDPDIYVAAT